MDEVGKRLRSARIEKGYTLDDLQQITKIQKRYLLALEQGKFAELPGEFYVRGFIKQYAATVGLDSEQMVQDYEDQTPVTRPRDYEQVAENNKRTTGRSNNSVGKRIRNNLGKIIIGLVALVIIASLYFYVSRLSNQPKTQIPDQSSQAVSSKKSATDSSSKESSATSASSKSSSKKQELSIKQDATDAKTFNVKHLPSGSNKLVVEATRRAWVMVTVTGGTGSTWQAVLAAGESHDVVIPDGVTSIAIRLGNAAATSMKINDKDVPISADATSVQNYTLNFESDN
ncbi:helix-turn-helix domain-containing protein [Lapidilactobacillus bayanensis]|uniref:helix-turn-helix domain-containing protein n=1 Tax=Lapidilactobacillus bayanensis TaxID=2485998 RepID=UPI000F77A545|nr:RodZ domain-containing protein [Lapidilactobacillus bayanensis]